MASNNYTLSLIVKMEDRASGGLKGLGRTLKSLEAIQRSVGRTFEGTGRTMANSSRAMAGSAREFERASRTMASAAAGMKSSFRDIERAGLRQQSVTGRMIGSQRRFFDGVESAGDVWRRQASSLRVYTDEALKLLRAQDRFKTFNLGPAQDIKAFEAVNKTVQSIKGVSLADTTENITDLVGALGNLGSAIEALPSASKYQFAFKTLFGDKMGADVINEQVRASYKFLELTGAAMKGRVEMEKMLDTIIKIGSSTGGRVSPQEILEMGRRGNPVIQGLSPEGLRNISTLIEDMGAQPTGTALMSLYQGLVGGQMPAYSAMAFQKLGLIDPSKVQYGRAQKLKKVMPGGNLLGSLMQEDPLKAADLLMERLKRSGVDTSNDRDVQKQLSILFPNRNAFRLMNMLTTQRGQVAKESSRAASAKGLTELYDQALDSPLGKLQKFEAALANFKSSVGLPMIEVGTKLGESLLPVADFFSRHPDVVKYGVELLVAYKVFRGFTETASALNGMGDLFSKLRGGATSTGVALDGASAKAGGLKSRLDGIPSTIKTTIAVAATGYALDRIWELYQASQQKGGAYAGADQAAMQAFKAGEQMKSAFAIRGKAVPDSYYKTGAVAALENLNRGGDVANIVNHSFKGALTRWLAVFGTHNDPFAGIGRISETQKRAPELQDPRMMTEFLKTIRSGGMKDVSGYSLGRFERDFLAAAFPQSYAQASQLLAHEMVGLASPTKTITDTFTQLQGPSGKLPGSFSNAATAADNFAARVGAASLFTPQVRPSFQPNSVPALPGRAPFTFGQGGFQKTGALAAPMGTPATAALPLTTRASSGERPINVTYSPTINASGQTPEQFQAQLSQHSQEVARLVGHEVQRQRELKG